MDGVRAKWELLHYFTIAFSIHSIHDEVTYLIYLFSNDNSLGQNEPSVYAEALKLVSNVLIHSCVLNKCAFSFDRSAA